MARKSINYVCQECGVAAPKWSGRCDSCGAWNTLVEEAAAESAPKGLGAKKGREIEFQGLKGEAEQPPRQITGISEFDRVSGGGWGRAREVLRDGPRHAEAHRRRDFC